nr:hypothetical protein [Tanacetum cinerariifolium]
MAAVVVVLTAAVAVAAAGGGVNGGCRLLMGTKEKKGGVVVAAVAVGLWMVGRRVGASDIVDRVDRVIRILFGFAEKSPLKKFSGGGDQLAGGRKMRVNIDSEALSMKPGDVIFWIAELSGLMATKMNGDDEVDGGRPWRNGGRRWTDGAVLAGKIKVLDATLEMEIHPENHTLDSATQLHELYNDMEKLGLK